jgi:hypothetical protein
MRTALTMSVAAAAIGLGTVSLWAAPTGIVVLPSAKPPPQLVQDNYDYYGSYTTGWGVMANALATSAADAGVASSRRKAGKIKSLSRYSAPPERETARPERGDT